MKSLIGTTLALLSAQAAYAANPVEGTWKGPIPGLTNCATSSTFYKENFVSYNLGSGCGNALGAYMGTYVLGEYAMTIFYAVAPSLPFGPLTMNYSLTNAGQNIRLTQPGGWEMNLLKQTPDAWDGVWSGLTGGSTNLTGSTTSVVAELRSGNFQSFVYDNTDPNGDNGGYLGVFGRVEVSGSTAAVSYALSTGDNSLKGTVISGVAFTYSAADGITMNNLAASSMQFYQELPTKVAATKLEGVWKGGLASGCSQTAQFTSNLFRAFSALCTDGSVGAFLGRFELDQPSNGKLTVHYHYTSPAGSNPATRVMDYTYTEATAAGLADRLQLTIDGTSPVLVMDYYRVKEATAATSLRFTLTGDKAAFEAAPGVFISAVAQTLGISEEYVQITSVEAAATAGSFTVTVWVLDDLAAQKPASQTGTAAAAMTGTVGGYSVQQVEQMQRAYSDACVLDPSSQQCGGTENGASAFSASMSLLGALFALGAVLARV